ncbi:squalene--hopene cyclase [Geotalea uraniireducens]|uniref:Squalene--hopene cyclase n=1 Tax=Geotalea uraniireducens TaxID=351604 RepID=A0ABM8EMF8_9BACT|nr:terpene cyclase/mutase family protein [Geotalea uraniireducens]BDV43614.1 squalene--hopene cyclase [Geotalea uraniireducens]
MEKSSNPVLRVIDGGNAHFAANKATNKADIPYLAAVLKNAAALLASRQREDGHWVFDLEADVTIPAEYVMLLRFIGREPDPTLAANIATYLLERQLPDGGWPLYAVDGDTDISASVKAYFALKLLGHDKRAPYMVRARLLILALGGAAKANIFTRITLALFGQVPWHTPPAMPVELMLVPRWFFIHLGKVSYWSRTVIVPLLILYHKQPVCRLRHDEGIAELFTTPPDMLGHLDRFRHDSWRKNAFIVVDRLLKRTIRLVPDRIRNRALAEAEQWTRSRMQGDGGIGAIYPAMANAVMALKALGYDEGDPDYRRGLMAIDNLLVHKRLQDGAPFSRGDDSGCFSLDRSSAAPELQPGSRHESAEKRDFTFCQPCNSPVWDTCLSLTALSEAGTAAAGRYSPDKTMAWLFSRQITTPGDWADKRPAVACGGWAFQYENSLYPDVDDTSKVLMSLFRAGALERPEYAGKIATAVEWVLAMQSSDGGWGAFDVDNNHLYLNDIPFADHGALLDPSTADVTGRCIEMLGMLGYGPDYTPIARGIEFLKKEQEPFGGWFGRWGVNYIYGTWSVLSGLQQAGEDMRSPYVAKAVQWLVSCQNSDGGWGETCASYNDASLAGSGASTASQTAWALLALMAAGQWAHGAVGGGIRYLTEAYHDGWDEKHFTGTGFPRVFYLRYYGYSLFFPVWALAVYARQRAGLKTVQEAVRDRHLAPFRAREGAVGH